MANNQETLLQNQIRINTADCAVLFRANVGMLFTADGRPIRTGLPKGFSDLFGHRRSDGRAVYLEVKTPRGRIRPEQQMFIENIKKTGAIAGIVRSVEEARRVINDG